ncbi:TetR family transcriptional regulator C-terminal domain-containing protein [Mucilaginibacter sp. RB4R14]|uniref:TetR family transcriptional regulator C-terminal domain-containing protein n=1 Tax=Mucilaginibacter aurantiaciroseus TaxID=2949308 RepID=UPI002091B5B4|nr:TetR family transcriptional regulator C-terminal domain-containing protein [Mucilaginibacter aurantiaciroseus]MCO5934039.1 TetR family transcriptional regulator C-terminal domain-containing protein [Mucilaginibacter aurantiaciroseus]
MATTESIQKAYIDYVLTEGQQPKSVYVFAKKNKMAEEDFYSFFGSFDAVEQSVWADLTLKTLSEVRAQEVWSQYSSREKALSFFYSFFELLKSNRSFALYSIKKHRSLGTLKVLEPTKDVFENFAENILNEGIETQELTDRKFFSKRYKDALWVQFGFVLNFWINDDSAGFEKTDEAIEKGVNVTFDLFQRSPIDNLFEYAKFLAKNSGLKEKMGF